MPRPRLNPDSPLTNADKMRRRSQRQKAAKKAEQEYIAALERAVCAAANGVALANWRNVFAETISRAHAGQSAPDKT